MKRWVAMLVAGLCLTGAARAEETSRAATNCAVPPELVSSDNSLKKVAEVVAKERKLDIVVVGTGSSTLSGPGGGGAAYPARLEVALRQKLGNVDVNVFSEAQTKRTAEEMVENLARLATERRPTLVIWQTGTVDAMRGINPDDFTTALDEGISAAQKAGADIVLLNPQYSPRMETMISVTPYMDNMRMVSQQRDVVLFDRFAIMRHWSEAGDFDLFGASHGLGLAKQVHDCIGRALADMVLNAAHLKTQN
ncbi:MAG: SGNH/GDSL hydrolase family protein [Xanthobacteraceae bacterium]|nr:MAG: SGNH/GDSL hydrolase family protein [Xanthobacteraceae bacterium]